PNEYSRHVQATIMQFRESTFQNRLLPGMEEPIVDPSSVGNKCEAEILVETQPLPELTASGTPLNAVILDVTGVVLGCTGWGLLLFLPAFPGIPELLLALATGLLAVGLGWKFLALAYRLHNTFRFRS